MATSSTTILRVAALLVVSLSTAEGQRTLMRTCDCEYVTNGKCAYTLLLPIGDAASTCPDQSENPGDHFPGQSSAETRMLQDQIHALRENLTLLHDWSWSQSKLLAQIQGAIISLQNGMKPVVPPGDATTEPTPGSRDPEIDAVIQQVGILSAEVGILKDTLLSTSGELASVSATVNELVGRFNKLNATLEQLKGIKTELVDNELKKNRWTCAKKGLLVSGDVEAIPDDNITTSSIFNDEHGSVKGRINNTNTPGAWCPKEPNTAYEWIQFDFGRDRLILGTVLKGRYDFTQWVTSYRVEYTTIADTSTWSQLRDVMEEIEIYTGNADQNTAQVNLFFNPVEASAIRIIPRVGYRNANKCLRADVIGCLDDVL